MLVARYQIQKGDEVFIDEFLAHPLGPYSPGLQRIMNLFRGGPFRLGLLCRKPFQEWVLITFQAPQQPFVIHEDCRFTSLVQAEIEIFRRRWLHYTGKDPYVKHHGV